jgi:hypothetical protein
MAGEINAVLQECQFGCELRQIVARRIETTFHADAEICKQRSLRGQKQQSPRGVVLRGDSDEPR